VKLPQNLRNEFKKPLGKLILDKDVSKEKILDEISNNHTDDILLITVGDATTERLLNYDIIPSIQIIDGLEKRYKRKNLPSSQQIQTNLQCDNPQGQISDQSLSTIKKAFNSKKPVRILVNGEEDLLVLPVCIEPTEKRIIAMYGQPNEGLVIVHVDTQIRNRIKSLLELMRRV
jgi:uncharacterized protein (UPF0218 family)